MSATRAVKDPVLTGPLFWAGLLALLAAVTLLSRTFVPIDETRYVSVAWEMWHQGSFLVPLKNGLPYSDKPPMLFWLIHLGWAVFGVSDWWPMLIAPIVSFLSLALFRFIVRCVAGEKTSLNNTAPLVLLGCGTWLLFSQALMFDMLLTFWALLGIAALASLRPRGNVLNFAVFALAIGGGALTKGPVILLHLLPPLLLLRWWSPLETLPHRWIAGAALATVAGIGITLAWALPAASAGGEAYRDAIFLVQTAERLSGEHAPHHGPVWWYLALLPFILLPWTLWPPVYRGLAALVRSKADATVRLALAWLVPPLLIFSIISGKQLHYMLPEVPAYALLIALGLEQRQEARRPWLPVTILIAMAAVGAWIGFGGYTFVTHSGPSPWLAAGLAAVALALAAARPTAPVQQVPRFAIGMVACAAAFLYFGFRPMSAAWDVRPMARAIRAQQEAGVTVAHGPHYHAQYQFAGRLDQPLQTVHLDDAAAWLGSHPNSAMVIYYRIDRIRQPVTPIAVQPYKSENAALLHAADALTVLRALGRTVPEQ